MGQYIAFIYDKGNGIVNPSTFTTIVTEYKEREKTGDNIEVFHLKDAIPNSVEPKKYRFIIGGQTVSKSDRYFVERLIPYVDNKGFDQSQTLESNIIVVNDNNDGKRSYYSKCAVKIKSKIKIH